MNCKQGELARIVAYDDLVAPHVGKIVRCVRPARSPWPQWPGWVVDPQIGGFDSVADACLRPINGGDITDSEVRDLYAPSDERMTATEVLARQHKPAHAGYPAP